jgi:hypothetical protein
LPSRSSLLFARAEAGGFLAERIQPSGRIFNPQRVGTIEAPHAHTRSCVTALILAALVSAAWAIRNLLEAWEPFSGSAGIGAVSVGFSTVSVGFYEVPVALLGFGIVGLILFNRRVAAAARLHSLLADRFRRAYLCMILAYAI